MRTSSVSKWFVTLGLAVAGGVVAYNEGHHGPPRNWDDAWSLFVVTLATAGLGAGAKLTNKAIDTATKAKETE